MGCNENELTTILITSLMEFSIIELLNNDITLIRNNLKEECINHRLALYIESFINQHPEYGSYNVDLEYNKNKENPKLILLEGKPVPIRPDIIVHKRGSNERNLLAIESKKRSKRKHDSDKLEALLKQPYNYRVSCYVIFYKKRVLIELYNQNKCFYRRYFLYSEWR